MPQPRNATLINPKTGKKIVVVSGSQQASDYFGQGFFLMGANGQPVTSAGSKPKPPKGSTAPVEKPSATPAPLAPQSPPATSVAPPGGSGKQATLYGPSGEREVVDVGSQRASDLQGRGWAMTSDEASSKKKATLVNRSTGEKRVVYVGSQEADSLLKTGWALPSAGSPVGSSAPVRNGERQDQADRARQDQESADELARLQRQREISAIKKELGGGDAPQAPNLGQTYNDLRRTNGVAGLEQSVNDIDSRIRDLDASFRQGNEQARNRLAPMSVISGEQRELAFQYQEQRNALLSEKQTAVDQLTTANNIIAMQMQFAQQDYSNAMAAYNAEYSRNLDAYNLWNKEKDAVKADASANLSTLLGMMKDSGKSWDDLDDGLRTSITKLEATIGLPPGSVGAFMSAKPGSKLLSTVEGYDAAGNGVVTFIYEDENGNPGIVKTVTTGNRRDSSDPSPNPAPDNTPVDKMTETQLRTDYNLSVDGLDGMVQVRAGGQGTLTREQAIDQLFDYYQGRISRDKIAKDVYRRFSDTYYD